MPIPLGILAVAGAGAAGGGAAFDLLTTTLISSNTASVTFSNLGNYTEYKHLQIRATYRGNRATGVLTSFNVLLNGQGVGNYSYHRLFGTGSTVISSGNANNTFQPESLPEASAPANSFGAAVIDFLDCYNANKRMTARALNGGFANTETEIRLDSAASLFSGPITSIELAAPEFFVSGSRFSLYGIK